MEVRSRALFGAAGEDELDYAERVHVLAIAAHQVERQKPGVAWNGR